MTRFQGRLPAVLLMGLGTLLGLVLMEGGARFAAVREERRQGRLDRDLDGLKAPGPGATVTLGQIIRKSSNPRVVYELRPRLDVRFAGGRLTTSDAGYRGADAPSPKPAEAFRIVGIGDSYMFGQGVSDDEAYLARLPRLMRGAVPNRTIETINLGVPGFNTVMEAALLRDRLALLDPDCILIEIVGNDLDLPNFLWSAVDPWTLRRSFLAEFVWQRLTGQRRPASVQGLSEAPRDGEGSAETFARDAARVPPQYASMVGLPAFEKAIGDLAAMAADRRIPLLAVTHGVWFEEALLKTLSDHAIPVLVLRSALRKRARALGAPDYARSP
ncbi:MAG: SGNH/GDSL hydrolase family protein, partial [Vicinamibacteria bacterium]|nr:SGNH/GDSL hydrolase family protein [Vicinamibacteria bacterium]